MSFFRVFAQQKVLFIGNSLTFYNDMPTLFENIAEMAGKDVEIVQHTPGGTGFIDHEANNQVYNLFASQQWDVVVLQPGSSESGGLSSTADQTIVRGKRLMDSIRVYSPCAKIVLYEISNGVAADNNGDPNYEHYFATQTKIRDTVTKIATGMEIPMVPAGECFRAYYEKNQDLLLHGHCNDVHPNLNGSYLVACAIFNTVYEQPVSGCEFYGNVETQIARYLQNISDSIVLTDVSQWFIDAYNLHADFFVTVDKMSVQLENNSQNYDSLSWNINNEFFSNELSLNYTFATAGEKSICLNAYKNGCKQSICKDVNIQQNAIFEAVCPKLKIIPNPVENWLALSGKIDGEYSVCIYDFTGKIIMKNDNLENDVIDVSFLKSGIYVLVAESKEGTKRLTFVKL